MAEYMPYFSLGTCMEGLNFLFYNLYGITLESQAVDSTEIWSPEVHKLVSDGHCYLREPIVCIFPLLNNCNELFRVDLSAT